MRIVVLIIFFLIILSNDSYSQTKIGVTIGYIGRDYNTLEPILIIGKDANIICDDSIQICFLFNDLEDANEGKQFFEQLFDIDSLKIEDRCEIYPYQEPKNESPYVIRIKKNQL